MLVLALDTSTSVMTVGLIRVYAEQHPQLVLERSFTGAFSHAEQLMPLAQAILTDAALTFADLGAIVVGLGPGPFTGLRVGIASAAALADALSIPVYGAPSHDAVASALIMDGAENTEQVPRARVAFAVVTDARRREVYLSGYGIPGAESADDNTEVTRMVGPVPVPPAEALHALVQAGVTPGVLIGGGAHLIPIPTDLNPVPTLVSAPKHSVSLGLVKVAKPTADGRPEPLVPLYLRRPDATEPGARKSVLGR